MTGKICCFGELLLRMSPELDRRWIHEASMPVFLGGAELNVASALCRWGIPVSYSTALPDHYLSREVVAELQEKGMDTQPVHFSGQRIGLYFLPQGADLKHAGVIYDRAGSSFYELRPGMLDWDRVLHEASWLHFSAISPALNDHAAAVCREGLEAARKKGIRISVDLNYRAKLWQYGKTPPQVMPGLVAYADLVMGNIWSANALLGIPVDKDLGAATTRERYLEHAVTTAQAIQQRFPQCSAVANTFRFDREDGGIRYYASLYTEGNAFHSPEFGADTIVNKVGSGDCFMAGLIYGMYNNMQPADVIAFAASAAFGKLQEPGDATQQEVSVIRQRIKQGVPHH